MFRRLTTMMMVTALACTGLALAQQEKKPDMDAMMQEWMKYAAPGPQHATFAKLAGKWTTATKSWMDPAAPPTESKGTADMQMVLGGRYLDQKYKGTVADMPYEGMGMLGYDNFGKRYMTHWSDNMSTTMIWATGTANAAGNEITLEGSYDDPMSGGKAKKFKEVMKIQGPDSYVFEWWEEREGKIVKTMEIVHTRAK
jgi:hypothetical protein